MGRLRAAWQQAPPLEGRLERPVPTFGKARKSGAALQAVLDEIANDPPRRRSKRETAEEEKLAAEAEAARRLKEEVERAAKAAAEAAAAAAACATVARGDSSHFGDCGRFACVCLLS